MLPSLAVMALFMFYPLIRAAWLSLTSYSFFGTSKFIGLGNYGHLLHDSQFWTDLGNTAYPPTGWTAPRWRCRPSSSSGSGKASAFTW
jgi:ABC-type sugar transport system permease subunit